MTVTERMPSCPRCTLNDRVITLPAPEPRPGRPLLDAESLWPFECTRCVLPFTGTDEEYVRLYRMREKYREDQKPRRPRPTDGEDQ